MPEDYSHITEDMFYDRVHEIAQRMGVSEIMSISGVYELVAEYLNNEVLESFDKAEKTEYEDDV